MKTIKMKFQTLTGEIVVEAHGFKGQSCAKATQFLKDTLGEVKDFQEKAEWYEEVLESTGECNSNLCG